LVYTVFLEAPEQWFPGDVHHCSGLGSPIPDRRSDDLAVVDLTSCCCESPCGRLTVSLRETVSLPQRPDDRSSRGGRRPPRDPALGVAGDRESGRTHPQAPGDRATTDMYNCTTLVFLWYTSAQRTRNYQHAESDSCLAHQRDWQVTRDPRAAPTRGRCSASLVGRLPGSRSHRLEQRLNATAFNRAVVNIDLASPVTTSTLTLCTPPG